MRCDSINSHSTKESLQGSAGEVEPGATSGARDWIALVVFTAICLAAGGIGARLTDTAVKTWFRTLQRPPLSPPDWIFGRKRRDFDHGFHEGHG